MTVPEWVQDSIFYQIFPDRFANGDLENDPPNVHAWGSPPTVRGFQGGDLQGILDRFDYLLDLGVNALYLNPIFQATSNHRYNTTDYFRIDPKLGDLPLFHTLLKRAHQNGMRVILDGVFNHCGRGFFAFNDVLENEADSPYRDWFHIRRFPLNAYTRGRARNYEAWWGIKSLPKFNTGHPQVRRYLLNVGRYWIEQGADGWRLDVPNEIADPDFWAEFRGVVRAANQDAYLLGEIWELEPGWVGEAGFDGLMNYPVRRAILGLLGPNGDPLSTFAKRLEVIREAYPASHLHVHYVPLGSHDTERLFTALDQDSTRVMLAYALLFFFPGAPAIFAGDEIGLAGGRDPDCRQAFPWDETRWRLDLRRWVQQLIAARKAHPALRRGTFDVVQATDLGHGLFVRRLPSEQAFLALNLSSVPAEIELPASPAPYRDILEGGSIERQAGKTRVRLAPMTARLVATEAPGEL